MKKTDMAPAENPKNAAPRVACRFIAVVCACSGPVIIEFEIVEFMFPPTYSLKLRSKARKADRREGGGGMNGRMRRQ